jgi:hypothetical protein
MPSVGTVLCLARRELFASRSILRILRSSSSIRLTSQGKDRICKWHDCIARRFPEDDSQGIPTPSRPGSSRGLPFFWLSRHVVQAIVPLEECKILR